VFSCPGIQPAFFKYDEVAVDILKPHADDCRMNWLRSTDAVALRFDYTDSNDRFAAN
jgi:hypothetical protein